MTLRKQLNGARLVMAPNDVEYTLAWHGGTGIHVYTDAGEEVDCFSVDSHMTNAAPEDVRQAMITYIEREGNDDEADA